MLSYRHGFHAGNWADVHKHALLAGLLGRLGAKDRPFCVLDAFAGDGRYALDAPEAGKTAEFRAGIARLWQRRDGPPALAWYLAQVRALNPGDRLVAYPGSPALARAALRPGDRLILCELHPTAHRSLRAWARGERRISVHRRDGFAALKALLPPAIRGGLVLIDPSYEVKADYAAVAPALATALARWPEAVQALWYPVLPEARHDAMLAALADLPAAAVLRAEMRPPAPPARGLRGAGLVLVNPPWRFDREAAAIGDWLAGALWTGALGDRPPGRHVVRWLRGAP